MFLADFAGTLERQARKPVIKPILHKVEARAGSSHSNKRYKMFMLKLNDRVAQLAKLIGI